MSHLVEFDHFILLDTVESQATTHKPEQSFEKFSFI